MEFYAHSGNRQKVWQPLTEHLQAVARLAAVFAGEFGAARAGEALGWLHDLGKRDALFQAVLRQNGAHVNHSAAGAAVALEVYEKDPNQPPTLADVLYAHHGELGMHKDLRTLLKGQLKGGGDNGDEKNNARTLMGEAAISQAMSGLQISLPSPKALPKPNLEPPELSGEEHSIRRMLWMRLLLSALVDADYTDTARHFSGETPELTRVLDIPAALAALTQKREAIIAASTAAQGINLQRNLLYADCVAAAARSKGLYTLTAPTGTGKTLALLAFALHHARQHALRRVFIILPYLSLMEQNVREYRDIIPDLLESHSMAQMNDQNQHLAERWNSPLIVTTSVQFFEALFRSRAPDCRRLHSLANSVVVFDEAQSLPAELLRPTLLALKALRDLCGCTVVFSTATQPSFDSLPELRWQADEILTDVPAMYRATRRVAVDFQLEPPAPLATLATDIAACPQSLTIVNLRRHARQLTALLKPLIAPEALFYLTTDLCAKHREQVLKGVHARLAQGLPCTVIATQCVEAGVDLDFPVLYRALAPLESIIQAAGRCNRNGRLQKGRVTVFVPDCEGKLYPSDWYQRGAECVRLLLTNGALDVHNPTHIKQYYDMLYGAGTPEKEKLAQAVREQDFHGVAEAYRLIEGAQYHIVAPYGTSPVTLDALETEGLTAKTMRLLQPYAVSTYDKAILEACAALPLRLPNGKLEKGGTLWYWLLRDDLYDSDCLGLREYTAPGFTSA